jgi:hypothetical protein
LVAVDVPSEVAAALQTLNASRYSSYMMTLQNANRTFPPPYAEKQYATDYQGHACDPFWLASCLLANAVKEADGARQLSVFAGCIPSDRSPIVDAVIRHATDEAKHARVFLQLLHLIFPEAEISDRLRSDLQAHLPSPPMNVVVSDRVPYSAEQLIDEISQINIGEIRTRINQLILRPLLLAHAPKEQKTRVRRIVDNLLHDEQKHIVYTAEILEHFAGNGYGPVLERIYLHRFRRFNERTIRELNGTQVDL